MEEKLAELGFVESSNEGDVYLSLSQYSDRCLVFDTNNSILYICEDGRDIELSRIESEYDLEKFTDLITR